MKFSSTPPSRVEIINVAATKSPTPWGVPWRLNGGPLNISIDHRTLHCVFSRHIFEGTIFKKQEFQTLYSGIMLNHNRRMTAFSSAKVILPTWTGTACCFCFKSIFCQPKRTMHVSFEWRKFCAERHWTEGGKPPGCLLSHTTIHYPNDGSMLCQRRRRWHNIGPSLG